jgi:hypothetical protein
MLYEKASMSTSTPIDLSYPHGSSRWQWALHICTPFLYRVSPVTTPQHSSASVHIVAGPHSLQPSRFAHIHPAPTFACPPCHPYQICPPPALCTHPRPFRTHKRTPVVRSHDPGASTRTNEPLRPIRKHCSLSPHHDARQTNSRSHEYPCWCGCGGRGR